MPVEALNMPRAVFPLPHRLKLLDLAKFQKRNGHQTRSNSKIQEKFSSIKI